MFSDKLRLLREERGLYQKDMADLLGTKTNSYSQYERGMTEPSIGNLIKLADFFCVSIDELVDHIEPSNVSNADSDRIVILSSLAKQLGKEDQEKLCEIAKAFVALQNAAKNESKAADQPKK